MTAPILVTGGTGTLGRTVVAQLRDAGADIRVLSRSRSGTQDGIRYLTGDLSTGTGLGAAVDGVGTIVHCASARTGDADATRNLVEAAEKAGAPHLVYVSIVGVDRLRWGYLKTKLDSEHIVEQSALPWTILRATQFFPLILSGPECWAGCRWCRYRRASRSSRSIPRRWRRGSPTSPSASPPDGSPISAARRSSASRT
jgi:uncharacterized protein YbjT (DUF2867 family)